MVLASARVLGAVMDLVCGFQFQHSTMRYSYRGKVEGRVSVSCHVGGYLSKVPILSILYELYHVCPQPHILGRRPGRFD
jgi:hypothetical protein